MWDDICKQLFSFCMGHNNKTKQQQKKKERKKNTGKKPIECTTKNECTTLR